MKWRNELLRLLLLVIYGRTAKCKQCNRKALKCNMEFSTEYGWFCNVTEWQVYMDEFESIYNRRIHANEKDSRTKGQLVGLQKL